MLILGIVNLPHLSFRNNPLLRRNPWLVRELILELRKRVVLYYRGEVSGVTVLSLR